MGSKPSLDEIFGSQAASSERPSLDSIFSEAPPSAAEPESFGKQLLRGTLDALPIAGGAAAGIITAPTGPAVAIPAAGLAYAAGGQLKRLGHKYLLGENVPDQTPVEQAKDVAGDTATGATYEMGGQVVSAAINPVASYISNKLGNGAGNLAIRATGLSPAKAAALPEGAGQQILDSSALSWNPLSDSAKQIAGRMTNEAAQVGGSSGKLWQGVAEDATQAAKEASFAPITKPLEMARNAIGTPVTALSAKAVGKAGNVVGSISKILSSNPQALGAYAQPLLKAMQGGEHSLAVTDFLMGQSDPQYREKRDSLLSQSNGQ